MFNPQDFPLTASREYAQAGFFYPAPGVSVTTLPMGGAPNVATTRPYAGVVRLVLGTPSDVLTVLSAVLCSE